MSSYEDHVRAAERYTGYGEGRPSYWEGLRNDTAEAAATRELAEANRGIIHAILALAAAQRGEPVRVDVKVNAEEVAARVTEALNTPKEG